MNFKELINKGFVIFDGGMGTLLQDRGLMTGEYPEVLNITHPEIIKKIHEEYILAGADIITTNTFGANEYKLKDSGYSPEVIIKAAVKNAREAKGEKIIALDIGPIGQMIEPAGTMSFDRSYEIHKKMVDSGVKYGCDLIIIETMSDLYEAKAAVLAAKENSSLPVICTMTFEETGRSFLGTDPVTMVTVLEGLGIDAIGVNCSLGPDSIKQVVEEILKYASIPAIVQPNAGLPRIMDNTPVYDITPEYFAKCMGDFTKRGVRILGGCCGTTPEYIMELKKAVSDIKPLELKEKGFTAVSSGMKTQFIDPSVCIIGEKINPTGKKRFKEAFESNDMDYILKLGISQMEAGAQVLDVNVGLPEIDEKSVMLNVIRELQSIINIPLQIDSADPDVLESAARYYNGKPLINSVNGKRTIMERVFPVVKKYGAAVIGLTLDEKGIPKTAEERFSIAEKIIETAKEYGIPKKNVIIDCLTLTASAEQEEVMEALKAVKMVTEKLQVNTCLGVSNVSYGLPGRDIINSTFFAMAMLNGLTTAIIDPTSEKMMETLAAYRLLSNQDTEGKEYLKKYSAHAVQKNSTYLSQSSVTLKDAIEMGLKDEAVKAAKVMLHEKKPMEIVDGFMIPALDSMGKKYEKGEVFLPQLIQSAEAVKEVFDVLKELISNCGGRALTKGKVVLATVKGDVHDIGKNIVKILLENYGFEVIDLGRDVEAEKIVTAAQYNDIKLIGLSALMTTTVKSMEEAIAELKKAGIKASVMVGGAVMNPQYSDMIGADFYAKEARDAVEIARKVYNVKIK